MPEKPGQPTKYRPEYCEKLIEHFSVNSHETIKDDSGRPHNLMTKFPTFEDFAHGLGHTVKTLDDWAKLNPEFLISMTRARELQRSILMQGGLSGAHNARICQLLLGTHGVIQKTEQSNIHANPDGTSIAASVDPLDIARRVAFLLMQAKNALEESGDSK